MNQYARIYNLDNRRFVLSKNDNGFPAECIAFSFHQLDNVLMGTFQGDGIIESHLLGKFVAADRIEVLFQWLDQSLLLFSGAFSGLICGPPSEKLHLFLNWQWLCGATGKGAASFIER